VTGEILLTQQVEKPLYTNWPPDSKTDLRTPGSSGRNFEIHVKGLLSDVWADWFEGLTIERLDDEKMVLSGYIIDQAALMGVLNKINRLNLTLLCVHEIEREK
jgi:hypothetical protein